MDGGPPAGRRSPRDLIVAGLGPGDLDRLPGATRTLLGDPEWHVVVRTLQHPAAAQLAEQRPVESCDDLYESAETFDGVYTAIAARVLERAQAGPTVYAVPGSPLVGEFAVGKLAEMVDDLEVVAAESFVDALLRRVGYDPFQRGLRIMNGHELPDPLVLDCPTVVGHLDAPAVLADVAAALSRVLEDGALVTVCVNLGSSDEKVLTVPVDSVPADMAGYRTSLFVDSVSAGLAGVAKVARRLRAECPWDREQTHASLVPHLVEEVNELIEAIAALAADSSPVDYVAYDGVEEELGDVLLQVLLHAAIAAEKGAFTIDDVATRLQEKLVRRHPHVFGEVEATTAAEVASNWEAIKAGEREQRAGSRMDGIPSGMSSLERAGAVQRRAAEVGFDWEKIGEVVAVLAGEVTELASALETAGDPAAELGDVLFSAVNVARHLGVSAETTLHQATARFERRFRTMEEQGPLAGLDLAALEQRWQASKAAEA